MADIEMPQLGETVTEGTITRWFKQVGEDVAEDEPLFEVSTDKVDSEVPSPMSGTVTEILVEEGDTVDVGTVLARVGEGGGGGGGGGSQESEPEPEPEPEQKSQPEKQEPEKQEPEKQQPEKQQPEKQQPEAQQQPGSKRLLSPVVRKLINENDLDVDAITGTGAGGRITRDDVLDAIDDGTAKAGTPAPGQPSSQTSQPSSQTSQPSTPAAPTPIAGERDTAVPHSRIRQASAEHLRRSVDTSAHVYASIEVDFDNVDRVRLARKDEFKSDEGFSLTYLPFVSRAVVDAIREYPEVNASFTPDELIIHNYVNLGIAVDLDFKGLLVPVIAGADGLRLRAIARSVRDLAARARSKKLGPDELSGGTFTITNPGPFGTTLTMPIINQPQVAILSTDGVKRRPVVVDLPDGGEAIAVHPTGNLTLTWDHRAFDGAYAAAFLKKIKDLLETVDWEQELG